MSNDVPFDIDEVPEAPGAVSGLPTELMEKVPRGGEPIPKGVYFFRLSSCTGAHSAEGPYYMVEWTCQQEPYVGRKAFENVPWVEAETVRAALAGDDGAVMRVKNRCWRAKEIFEAAGYKASTYDFAAFAATNPEVKLSLDLEEVKRKDPSGKLVPTGEFRNRIVRHINPNRAT